MHEHCLHHQIRKCNIIIANIIGTIEVIKGNNKMWFSIVYSRLKTMAFVETLLEEYALKFLNILKFVLN